jgi:RPA family protein
MTVKQTFDQTIFASIRPLMKDIVKADESVLDSHRLETKFKHLRHARRSRRQKN